MEQGKLTYSPLGKAPEKLKTKVKTVEEQEEKQRKAIEELGVRQLIII